MKRKSVIAAWALAGLALSAFVLPAQAENASAVRATAPAQVARTYDDLDAALTAADLDQIVTDARQAEAGGSASSQDLTVLLFNAMLANDLPEAQRIAALGQGNVPNLFSPFLTLEHGGVELALSEFQDITVRLPPPLSDYGTALMFEAAGRFEDAATMYAVIERGLTVVPFEGEPRDSSELMQLLGEARTSTILFRAAQVQHRLGNYQEAQRLYGLVAAFTPQSVRLRQEQQAVARRRPPVQAALSARGALAQWLFVLADYANNTEGMARVFASDVPLDTIPSPTAALYFQFGVLFDPQAEEYIVAAANQILDVQGFQGADRLLSRIGDRSPYLAEAALTRAQIALELREDDNARRFALAAARAGNDRWGILAGAADVLSDAGANQDAIRTLDRALTLTETPEERARIYSLRALTWRQAGDINRAVTDARAALEIERNDDTRLAAISVMMEHPTAWREAISEARAMLAANPDSVLRLNALGYALIQHPEGLEEGFRLLWRGYAMNNRNDALVDSLGWAYYLYGQFDEALVLIARAHELTGDQPNAEILDHLGDVHWRLGQQDEARSAWTQALAARPETSRRATLEAKLRSGLTTPAPETREPPQVALPERGGRPQDET